MLKEEERGAELARAESEQALEKLLREVIITSVLDEDPPRLVVGGGGGGGLYKTPPI